MFTKAFLRGPVSGPASWGQLLNPPWKVGREAHPHKGESGGGTAQTLLWLQVRSGQLWTLIAIREVKCTGFRGCMCFTDSRLCSPLLLSSYLLLGPSLFAAIYKSIKQILQTGGMALVFFFFFISYSVPADEIMPRQFSSSEQLRTMFQKMSLKEPSLSSALSPRKVILSAPYRFLCLII